MYNMDNSTMMTTLDISTLIASKYLKDYPRKPTEECDYYSDGDLTDKYGDIFCKKHGSFTFIARSREEKDKESEKEREEEKKTVNYKIIQFFSSFDNSLRQSTHNLIEIFEKTIKIFPLWELFGSVIFYTVIFGLGFTIEVTRPAYLIFSIISLVIVSYDYYSDKMEINKKIVPKNIKRTINKTKNK